MLHVFTAWHKRYPFYQNFWAFIKKGCIQETFIKQPLFFFLGCISPKISYGIVRFTFLLLLSSKIPKDLTIKICSFAHFQHFKGRVLGYTQSTGTEIQSLLAFLVDHNSCSKVCPKSSPSKWKEHHFLSFEWGYEWKWKGRPVPQQMCFMATQLTETDLY